MSLEFGLEKSWTLVLPGACALVLLAAPLCAQDDPMAGLEHRFADVGALQIEYFQFGDTGTPIILIQDHHDYFHGYFGREEWDELQEWIDFLNEMGRHHRVVAPVRRGWGESDDPGYGYDVATQAEDILGLMDRLGIAEAVLLGRTLATQEMTWIAEHHPERVAGLAYWGTPMGHLPDLDPTPEVTRFAEMYNRVACDIGAGVGEAIDARLGPRRGWRPHFTRDAGRRIEIPALLVLHPVFDRVSMESRRLDRIEAWAPDDFGDPDGWCDEEARTYFTELSGNHERIASLRPAFDQMDGLSRTQDAMRGAFGSHLVVVWEEEQPENPVFGPLTGALEAFVRTVEGAGLNDQTPGGPMNSIGVYP
jgi:pimeloyl-ACP methyl ester carboxylesterase